MSKKIANIKITPTSELVATRVNGYKLKFEMIFTDQLEQSGAMILTKSDVRNMLKAFEQLELENKKRALSLGIGQPYE